MASVAAVKRTVDVQGQILDALQRRETRGEQPYRPTELLEELGRDISVSEVKDELAALIRDQKVEFSPDRRLRLRAVVAEAAT